MHAESRARRAVRHDATCTAVLLGGLLLWLAAGPATAQEAVPVADPAPEPLPVAAEAAYQQASSGDSDRRLDEAIFTEISPVSVPDQGLRLPGDQED